MPAGRARSESSDSTNLNLKAANKTFKTSVICALALTALAATAVQAQTTRAEVKAEARGTTATQPKGELSVANQDKGARPMGSVTDRADVKAETKAVRANGEIARGEQSTPRQGKKPAPRMASKESRAQVKAEAAAATKAGGLSRGEASVVGQDKGGIKP